MFDYFADTSKYCGLYLDGAGDNRLQDQAQRLNPGSVATGPQPVAKCLVDNPFVQTYEGFPQIRFLPGNYKTNKRSTKINFMSL